MHRTAIIHEWLTEFAGSEKVVEQLLAIYPNADLHTLVDHLPADRRDWLGNRRIETTWLQRLPASRRWFRSLLPFFPQTIERFDLSKYDLVLSSHHCVAKGVLTRADQIHVCYVHSPMRYAWDLTHQYLGGNGAARWLRRQFAWPFLHNLRTWDVVSANRVDHFIANSRTVADRIWRCWRREAAVVFPPVDTDFFTPGAEPRADFWLHAGRLVGYKRADLAIQAFAGLPNQRLVIAGDGPELTRLRRRAPPNVTFVGRPDGNELRRLLRTCRGLVFCAEEDFGILPVEAMACGAPVVAFGRGGATETVVHGQTGWLFPEQEPEDLIRAISNAESHPWDHAAIRRHAEGFGCARFREQMQAQIAAARRNSRRADTPSPPPRPPIAIWTREAYGDASAGRPRLIAALRSGPLVEARHLRLQHAFELGPWQVLRVGLRAAWRFATLRPDPLQCLLFSAPAAVESVLSRCPGDDRRTVYLDGIRCLPVARALAARGHRLIIDLDDLMSRRCELLQASGEKPNAGYLNRTLPAPLVWALSRMGRLVLTYERRTLIRAERELVSLSQHTTLLSPFETTALRSQVGAALADRIICVPPEQAMIRANACSRPPFRFIFVGGETLTQNRLTLERLAALWRTYHPNRPLHWYGRRAQHGIDLPDGFISHGFVDDLAGTAYDDHSILLNPTGLAGGVKTKVLEALAHGCPVIGNPAAFEGLGWNDYPLIFEDEAPTWSNLLRDPEGQAEALRQAVIIGQRHLITDHSPATFTSNWQKLLGILPGESA